MFDQNFVYESQMDYEDRRQQLTAAYQNAKADRELVVGKIHQVLQLLSRYSMKWGQRLQANTKKSQVHY